jgi:hypothetical protein
MRRYIFALASILLIGAGPTFPTEEEQARIAEPYSACMRAATERIDDGRIEIAAIAKAVAEVCKPQFDQMVAILGKDLSAEDRETLRSKLSEMQVGYAAVAVGKVRLDKHAAATHQ